MQYSADVPYPSINPLSCSVSISPKRNKLHNAYKTNKHKTKLILNNVLLFQYILNALAEIGSATGYDPRKSFQIE